MTTDESMNVLKGLEQELAKAVKGDTDNAIEVEFATHNGEPLVNKYSVKGPRSILPASISAAANLALFGSEDVGGVNEPVILSVETNAASQVTPTGAATTQPENTEPKESLILEPEVKPVETEVKASTKSKKTAPEAVAVEAVATTVSIDPNVYAFGDAVVRTDRTDTGEPLFCAKDVCDILGYANARDAVRQHTDSNYDVVKCDIIDKLGRKQTMTFVNESGLYALIFGSKLESAKAFKRWVTSEVLPSIRKTGAYTANQTESKPKALTLETKVNVARIVLEAAGITGNQLALALDKGIRKDTGESSLEWTGTQLVAPTQERLLNPTELGKPLGLSPRAVNSRLQAKGFQIKGVAGWELTASGKALGGVYLDTGKKHSSGVPVRQIKWPATVATEL